MQHDSIRRENTLNKAEFVFEAVVKKIDYYPRIDNNGKKQGASSWILKITKIFRGNLKPGTVEMIAENPASVAESQRNSDKHLSDTLCIFFCRVAIEYPYDPKLQY